MSSPSELLEKPKYTWQQWVMYFMIVLFLCLLMAAIAYSILHPQIVVNNYISSGNYTFDIGERFASAINTTRGLP